MRTFPSGKATITQPDRGAGGVPMEKSQHFAVLYLTTHQFRNISPASFLRVSDMSFLTTSYILDAINIFISLLILCTMTWYFKVVSFTFELHLTIRTLNGVHPYICLFTADYESIHSRFKWNVNKRMFHEWFSWFLPRNNCYNPFWSYKFLAFL